MNERLPHEIDPADRLPSLADFLGELAGAVSVDDVDVAEQEAVYVSEIKLDLPFELNLLEELGAWQLDAAPPTQKIETTVMPVWHRVRLTVAVNDGERDIESVEA
jgi:hypothetical protein